MIFKIPSDNHYTIAPSKNGGSLHLSCIAVQPRCLLIPIIGMPSNVHITEYAPPVLRAPSPASSVGTVYGEDQTSFSDLELSDEALAKKYEDLLDLRKPRKEEDEANQTPLLDRPEKGSQQETGIPTVAILDWTDIMICLA